MFSTYDNQNYLINTMASLKEVECGFYENKGGVCHGTAMMGLVAYFSKGLHTFRTRLDYISQSQQKGINIKEKIADTQKLLEKEKRVTLTKAENLLFNVWGFCDGISLFQVPENYVAVLGLKLYQSQSVEVSEFIGSQKLQARGGLKQIEKWESCYALCDLIHYLEALTITAKNCKRRIGLLLNTGPLYRQYPHAISLCWGHKTQRWVLIDVNNPIKEFDETQLALLAQAIFASFWDKDVTSFQTILYGVGDREKQMQEFFIKLMETQKFKISHDINSIMEILPILHAWELLNKVCEAIKNRNSLDEIKLDVMVDLNQYSIFCEETPLCLAIEYQRIDCITWLLEHVNINATKPNGETALHKAIEIKNLNIIRFLIEKGADVNIANHNGVTPLMLMSNDEELKALECLIVKKNKCVPKLKIKRYVAVKSEIVKEQELTMTTNPFNIFSKKRSAPTANDDKIFKKMRC